MQHSKALPLCARLGNSSKALQTEQCPGPTFSRPRSCSTGSSTAVLQFLGLAQRDRGKMLLKSLNVAQNPTFSRPRSCSTVSSPPNSSTE
jgi:hypothetical protein